MQHNGDWAYGPLMKALALAVLRTGCRQRLSWKNHKQCTVRLLTRLLSQQTRSSSHLCVNGVLFFPVSASVVSKRLLWPNKWGKNWWLQTMKVETPAITIAIGAAKDNEKKIFEIITWSLDKWMKKLLNTSFILVLYCSLFKSYTLQFTEKGMEPETCLIRYLNVFNRNFEPQAVQAQTSCKHNIDALSPFELIWWTC